ncbi:glycosyltransferase family 2 protein [Photobacterium aphoticum]|uniref:Glycosyl transferase family 2 n=2 Tax=Photobacterium aphoticum TaxID=754436 RepID=A0A0J1GGS0_9GAMM|nr:glycosyltransferase family 2 protein [Photobacterium aphoticum]KLU98914.1 hypothetical protein ABT58_20250 [Photobacterium aphoticum]
MFERIKNYFIKAKNSVVKHERIKAPKLFMTILAKNEADIIEHQIIYHRAMGVDGFIVTDNNSSDATREIFEKYKKKGWIKEIICEISNNHDQKKWVDRMIRIASEKYNADWIINSDADEFWCCSSSSLKDELAKTTSNVIYVDIYNIYPHETNKFYENDNLIKNYERVPESIKNKLSPYSIYDKQIQKVIHRTKGYLSIENGNHNVRIKKKSSVKSDNIIIYHYSLRGLEHFKRKMINGGASVNNNEELSENAAQHWRYFYDIFINQGREYQDEYDRVIGTKYFDDMKNNGVFESAYKVKNFFTGYNND